MKKHGKISLSFICLETGDLGWNPFVTSWIETRENQSEKANLTILFDKYVPTLQEVIKHRFKKVTPIPNITHIEVLCKLLEVLIIPQNIPYDSPKELFEMYFVFACIWAYGSALYYDGTTDHRFAYINIDSFLFLINIFYFLFKS